jgi:hypothetical protein
MVRRCDHPFSLKQGNTSVAPLTAAGRRRSPDVDAGAGPVLVGLAPFDWIGLRGAAVAPRNAHPVALLVDPCHPHEVALQPSATAASATGPSWAPTRSICPIGARQERPPNPGVDKRRVPHARQKQRRKSSLSFPAGAVRICGGPQSNEQFRFSAVISLVQMRCLPCVTSASNSIRRLSTIKG